MRSEVVSLLLSTMWVIDRAALRSLVPGACSALASKPYNPY